MRSHVPPSYIASHMTRLHPDHGWSMLSISSHLFDNRMRGYDPHFELHFMLSRIRSLRRYLLDRLTDAELAYVAETESNNPDPQEMEGREVARTELNLRTRGAFECASMGQLPLPPELIQLVGQFHSPAITPTRPARLHPPSYTAAVAAIRAELADAPDPAAGHARAASQMDALHHTESRKKQRCA